MKTFQYERNYYSRITSLSLISIALFQSASPVRVSGALPGL
ncbi:MAG: hypothetical protein SGI89_08260 [bacterium]|nr:hypothetical protein [bacterium]